MSIRFARKADCAAIAEIYNHAVLYTAAIWNDQKVLISIMKTWAVRYLMQCYHYLIHLRAFPFVA